MRPVVLDMNGFAAFRAPARVDFTDASFFALVGPTGSGKSTVIDAMTFALYGSVPRWGRRGMVSLALAPTTGRATVRLVFEAAGQRYVVARELRRIGSQVSQRAATLERIAARDGLAEPGEATEVLAKDRGVAEAVERLLGLSYDDFCQCVVLPQGQFAQFLHAKPGDRQAILLRLLGAEHYKQMMVQANQRASAAGQRADALGETAAAFADATPDAEHEAQAAEKALTVLNERVKQAVPEIDAAHRDLAGAAGELERLERERAALAAIRVPDGTAALDTRLAQARKGLEQARAAERAAAEADTAARQALAGGPRRAPLELARQRRQELSQRAARRPELEQATERMGGVSRRADDAVAGAEAGLEQLRTGRDEAARVAETAGQVVRDLSGAHATLAAVAVPAGVSQLDERERTAASADGRRPRSASKSPNRPNARPGRPSTPPSAWARWNGPSVTSRDLNELALAQAAAQATGDPGHPGTAGRGRGRSSRPKPDRRERQHQLDEARRTHLAADLRTHLEPGQPCPVCDQPVTARPAPLDALAIEKAQDHARPGGDRGRGGPPARRFRRDGGSQGRLRPGSAGRPAGQAPEGTGRPAVRAAGEGEPDRRGRVRRGRRQWPDRAARAGSSVEAALAAGRGGAGFSPEAGRRRPGGRAGLDGARRQASSAEDAHGAVQGEAATGSPRPDMRSATGWPAWAPRRPATPAWRPPGPRCPGGPRRRPGNARPSWPEPGPRPRRPRTGSGRRGTGSPRPTATWAGLRADAARAAREQQGPGPGWRS